MKYVGKKFNFEDLLSKEFVDNKISDKVIDTIICVP